jgi:hypothetical protein
MHGSRSKIPSKNIVRHRCAEGYNSGVKGLMCRLSWNLGASTSWNPQGVSRPVMGLLYLLHLNYIWFSGDKSSPIFNLSLVCNWAVGHPQASDALSQGKEPPVHLNRRLSAHQNRSGLFGEALTVLLLPNVKARFLGYPVRSVVTESPEIFWLCLHLFEPVNVEFSPRNRSHCAYEAHVHPPVDVYGVCGFSYYCFILSGRQRVCGGLHFGPVTFLLSTQLISPSVFRTNYFIRRYCPFMSGCV